MNSKQLENVKVAVKELQYLYHAQYDTKNEICVDALTKDVEVVRFLSKESFFDTYDIKVPKIKPFTAEYVLERISKKQKIAYVNYTDVFKTIIDKIELPRRVSATSYGLGIEAIFGTREANFKDMHAVGDKLKEYGIEFTYGASEAEWVRQIRISKKQSNIDRIKALK